MLLKCSYTVLHTIFLLFYIQRFILLLLLLLRVLSVSEMLPRLRSRLCGPVSSSIIQTRNTVIVKRVHKPPLIGDNPLKTPQKVIDKAVVHSDDDKWMLYEVSEKNQTHHNIKLILLRNVDDFGKKGQVINVEFRLAYVHLLLPKFAVYHSEENCEKYKDILIPEGEEVFSSPSVQEFYNTFSKRVFDVCMNIKNPWTIEPWHIKATLRFIKQKF